MGGLVSEVDSLDRKKIGTAAIILGILAWPIGLFILHWKPVPDILTVHLSLIIPGLYLRGSKLLGLIRKN